MLKSISPPSSVDVIRSIPELTKASCGGEGWGGEGRDGEGRGGEGWGGEGWGGEGRDREGRDGEGRGGEGWGGEGRGGEGRDGEGWGGMGASMEKINTPGPATPSPQAIPHTLLIFHPASLVHISCVKGELSLSITLIVLPVTLHGWDHAPFS